MVDPECSVWGCENPVRSRNICGKHYERWRKYGDVHRTKFPGMGVSSLEEAVRAVGWTVLESGCWEWKGAVASFGYGRLMYQRKIGLLHRISYELWIGPIPEGHVVRHKCDNPPCMNPDHLQSGTVEENVQDRVSRGRSNYLSGSDHPSSKLTEDDVRSIRSRYKPRSVTQQALANEYGVSREHIRDIVHRRKWVHVD